MSTERHVSSSALFTFWSGGTLLLEVCLQMMKFMPC